MPRLTIPIPGRPVPPPSASEQALLAQAVAAALPGPKNKPPTGLPPGSVLVRVRNTTDDDWPTRSIVAPVPDSLTIHDLTATPADDPYQILLPIPRFDARAPRFPEDRWQTLVTLENIAARTETTPGQTGFALLAGTIAVRCDVASRSHRYAAPIDGTTDRLTTAPIGPARLLYLDADPETPLDPDPGRWAIVELTGAAGSGPPIGAKIVGQLMQPLAAATWSGGGRREGTTALVRVWDIDPANELTDQTRYQYEILDWTPTDPDDLPAGQSVTIGTDIRYRLADFHPLHVIDSTGRDAIYTVADGWESSDNWDAGLSRLTIPLNETVATVEDGDPPEPVIDGTLVLPGAPLLAATSRYELLTHRGTTTRPRLATITATWTGIEWLADLP